MKKVIKYFVLIGTIMLLCGCKNTNDDIKRYNAYTSVYPIRYIIENMYDDKMVINSIYPNGIKYDSYSLTNTQIEDIEKNSFYIYSGSISKEQDYAVKMLNKNIKIIDSTQGMDYTNGIEELWLSPSNFLMMASNIKKGFEEYVNEAIEIKKINKSYNELKLKLSEVDAEIKATANSSNDPTIIVSSDTFKFLNDYGFNVISIEENENLTDKVLSDVKKLFANKSVSYIFLKDNEKESKTITNLKEEFSDIQTLNLNSISTITDEQQKDKKDYISLMEDNISTLKLEILK